MNDIENYYDWMINDREMINYDMTVKMDNLINYQMTNFW